MGRRRCSARVAVVLVSVGALLVVGSPAQAATATDPVFRAQNGGSVAIQAVAPFGNGFVAVGSENDAGAQNIHLAAWIRTTPTGSWTRVSDDSFDQGDLDAGNPLGPDAQGATTQSVAFAVTAGTNGIVIGGNAAINNQIDPGHVLTTGKVPVVWYSVDGSTWTSVRLPTSNSGEQRIGSVYGVTSQSGRYVAVGVLATNATLDYSDPSNQPAAWYSDDGTTWHLSAPMNASSVGGLAWAVTANARHASPAFVAVGHIDASGNDAGVPWDAASWTSDDGTTWTQGPDTPALEGARGTNTHMNAVVAAAPAHTFYAAGYTTIPSTKNGAKGLVWSSRDGLHWTRVRYPYASKDTSRPFMNLTGIATSKHDLVVVGDSTIGAATENARPYVWETTDAKSWKPVKFTDKSNTDNTAMVGLAFQGSRYTIVGRGGSDAQTWDGG